MFLSRLTGLISLISVTNGESFQEAPEKLIAAFLVIFMTFFSEQGAQLGLGDAGMGQFQDLQQGLFFQFQGNTQFLEDDIVGDGRWNILLLGLVFFLASFLKNETIE